MPSVFTELYKLRYCQSDTVGKFFLSLTFTFQLKSQGTKSIDIYLNSTKDKGHASDVFYLHKNPPKSWKPLLWR